MPSGLSTRMNSDRAKGTSWGYRCSMLWEEKTASTDSEETEDMSVMVPTRSGLTDSSMSKRSSFQEDRALVVRSLRLEPQPTCRKVFMGFHKKPPLPCERWGFGLTNPRGGEGCLWGRLDRDEVASNNTCCTSNTYQCCDQNQTSTKISISLGS